MKRLFLWVNFIGTLFLLAIPLPSAQLVKVVLSEPNALERLQASGLDLTFFDREGLMEVVIHNEDEMNRLRRLGLPYWVAIPQLEEFFANRLAPHRDDMGGYKTFSEIVEELDRLHEEFSDIVSSPFSIGESVEGRPLWMVRVSDNPEDDEDEPEVLFTALIHSREVITAEVLLRTIRYLGEQYQEDRAVRELVEERELYFLPCHNPDGYVYNEETNPRGGGMWRKNRRDNGNGTFGVDLNRNFGYRWGYDNIGSSPTPRDETYRGSNPFSEPETDAIRNFVNNRNIRISLYFHSYSNLCLYPPGYDLYQPQDWEVFAALSQKLTAHNGYIYGTPWEVIYRVNGSSDDWLFYGDEHEPVYAFTIEVGSQDDNFWPPLNRVEPLVQENIPTCLVAALYADNPRRALSPLTPINVRARRVGESRVVISLQPQEDDDNPPHFYRVKAMRGNDLFWAGFEEEDQDWEGVNVSRTSQQSYEGRFSYAIDTRQEFATLTFTREFPLPDTIWVWLRWDLRRNLGHGVALEVTFDGFQWYPLPGTHTQNLVVNNINLGPAVTETSNNTWRRVGWMTGERQGEMGKLRFRYYQLGSFRLSEHCYIDQVGPLPTWQWEGIVGDSLLEPAGVDTFRGDDWQYAVQAIDGEGDESFWSLPVNIEEPLPPLRWTLHTGWNLVGLPLDPPPDHNGWRLLDPLWEGGRLIAVKDAYGRFELRRWGVNNLDEFDPRKGIFLLMEDTLHWEWEGEWVNPQTPIPLEAGWNGVAYLSPQPMSPQDALSTIAGNVIFLRDGEGRFWWPEEDFDNIGQMLPGMGYLLKVREPDTLIFPYGEGIAALSSPFQPSLPTPSHSALPTSFTPLSSHAYFLLIDLPSFPGQGFIWAIDDQGKRAGGIQVREGERTIGLAVWGQDITVGDKISPSERSGGLRDGQPFSLCWQPDGKEELVPLVVDKPQELRYTPNQFTRLKAFEEGGSQTPHFHLFPNPFNSYLTLSVKLTTHQTAQLEILDTQGRNIRRWDLKGISTSEALRVTWDGRRYPSGIYFARLNIDDPEGFRSTTLKKVLLVR